MEQCFSQWTLPKTGAHLGYQSKESYTSPYSWDSWSSVVYIANNLRIRSCTNCDWDMVLNFYYCVKATVCFQGPLYAGFGIFGALHIPSSSSSSQSSGYSAGNPCHGMSEQHISFVNYSSLISKTIFFLKKKSNKPNYLIIEMHKKRGKVYGENLHIYRMINNVMFLQDMTYRQRKFP